MRTPNLFLVGAARSGTTSLWQCLKSHPQVFMPAEPLQKEPAFFSLLKRSRYKVPERYFELFAPAGAQHEWVGEASTAYLTDPDSARRIHEYNPRAKIIIMLRHPAQRAYSLYNWMVQQGYEYAGTFAEALRLEEMRTRKKIPNYHEPEYFYNYLYFLSGMYSMQVERYFALFKDRVLLIRFEDFVHDFKAVWCAVCGFLQIGTVPPVPAPLELDLNETRQARSSVTQFILRKLTRFCLAHEREIRECLDADSGTCASKRERIAKKLDIKRKLLQQVHRDMAMLAEEKKIGVREHFLTRRYCRQAIARLLTQEVEIKRDSTSSRDSLVRIGMQARRPADMPAVIFASLLDGYRKDIRALSMLSGVDFSGWDS